MGSWARGPAALPPLPRTQSNEAEEQPQEQQPGEQQAQQPLPPAAAGAAGAPGGRCSPWAPASATAAAAAAAFTATDTVVVIVAVAVDICGGEKGEVKAGGLALFPLNSPASGDFLWARVNVSESLRVLCGSVKDEAGE